MLQPFLPQTTALVSYTTGSLNVIIDDHRRWIAGDCSASGGAPMRHHFCPDDESWREMVLWRGQQVLRQALAGLAADN